MPDIRDPHPLDASAREAWERPIANQPQWDVDAEWYVMANRMSSGPELQHRSKVGYRYGFPITAAALILVAAYSAWNATLRDSNKATPQKEFITRPGQRTSMQLADGSAVMMAPDSRVRYDADFGKSSRDIYLEGQALFTVTNTSGIPFVVHTSNSSIRVLGTRFGVRTYTDSMEVAVATGRVSVGNNTVSTGDVATIRAGQITVAHNAPVSDMIAWTEGKLVFKDVPLVSAIPELERWFNIEVVLADSVLKGRHLSGVLMDQSASEAIQALNILLGTRADITGRRVVLSKR